MPLFAQRQTPVVDRPGSLLETFRGFGFGWSGGFESDLYDALPVGARTIIEGWRAGTARRATAWVPPVVISEIPQTVLPQQTPRGQIPSKVDLPETWEELEELIPEIFEPILETRPGRTPDPYPGSEASRAVIDPTQTPVSGVDDEEFTEEEPMAHSWWHLGSQVIDVLQGQAAGGGTALAPPQGFAGPMTPTPGTPAFYAANAAAAGTHCRRRRRRRALLTEGDFNSLMRIATLPNNANVRTALAKAVGRR